MKTEASLGIFSPRLVIPTHAGIQVSIVAWIPAFAGKTEDCGYLAYSGFFVPMGAFTHTCFRRTYGGRGVKEAMKNGVMQYWNAGVVVGYFDDPHC